MSEASFAPVQRSESRPGIERAGDSVPIEDKPLREPTAPAISGAQKAEWASEDAATLERVRGQLGVGSAGQKIVESGRKLSLYERAYGPFIDEKPSSTAEHIRLLKERIEQCRAQEDILGQKLASGKISDAQHLADSAYWFSLQQKAQDKLYEFEPESRPKVRPHYPSRMGNQ